MRTATPSVSTGACITGHYSKQDSTHKKLYIYSPMFTINNSIWSCSLMSPVRKILVERSKNTHLLPVSSISTRSYDSPPSLSSRINRALYFDTGTTRYSCSSSSVVRSAATLPHVRVYHCHELWYMIPNLTLLGPQSHFGDKLLGI